MTSQIDICNRALLSIGARTTIASFTEGSIEGNSCAILFQPTFEQLARTSQWGCLRRQIILTLVSAAQGTPENPSGTTMPLPPVPWLYSYAYPSDALRIWWIVPSFPSSTGSTTPQTTTNNAAGSWIPNSGQINYQISSGQDKLGNTINVILTNQDQAQAVYGYNQPDPQYWDSLFQQAMVASLGAYLVPALSLSPALMQQSIKTAEQAISISRAIDGNEGVTVMDHVPDWFVARAGAQGFGLGSSSGWNFAIFPFGVEMTWPIYN